MNRFFQCVGVTALLLACDLVLATEISAKQIASRTELHSIPTLTISDRQFLTGDASGTRVTISGQLRIAAGEGRLPVVVLQHGSGGYVGNVDYWARDLNELGVSTFVLDGFTGRGLKETNTNQGNLGRLNFILDDYRALEILAKHPRVDAHRVVLMGFSRGGQAALYAGLKRFNKLWNKSGIEFVAYVPFYPDCVTTYLSELEVTGGSIRVFGGALDDYDPIALCKPYVERLRGAGRDITLTEYPTASHSFDNPAHHNPAVLQPKFQSVRNCKIKEIREGLLVNEKTNQVFTYQDPCVATGVHIGYDPAALNSATEAVHQFLKVVLRLN